MYSVNTMTLTASVGAPINLGDVELLKDTYERMGISSAPYPHHITCRRTSDGTVRKGTAVTKTNGYKRVYRKKPFDNQVTVVFMTSAGTFVNMKVFRTGKTQMTGARSEESARECVARLMLLLGMPEAPVDARVHLMNAVHDHGCPVNREDLYMVVRERHRILVSFQPEIHPSVKIGYFSNPSRSGKCQADSPCEGKETDCCKKVTIMVFHTGKVIMTGATKRAQLDEAFEFVSSVLRKLDSSQERASIA